MNPLYFGTPEELRAWLAENHDKATELQIGFYKVSTKKQSITYAQALDEALAFGWIDGVRHSIDEERWTQRYTPRKKGSIWSAVNIKRVGELKELGRMHPAGLKVFEERDERKTQLYSHERENLAFSEAQEQQLKGNEKAWAYFQKQPPSYQRAAIWWVISAKREETQEKRLATLIEDSANGRTIKPLTPPSKRK
ncbi:MAG: YdeI/OmpD-associated family protein [Anaerolineae bacterium]|nr:YdeI/OmpD-associated family protein [Anaerolineae bacterium]